MYWYILNDFNDKFKIRKRLSPSMLVVPKVKPIYKLKRKRFLRLIGLITLFILIICLSFFVALQLFIYLNY
jgi:hypothetical protein